MIPHPLALAAQGIPERTARRWQAAGRMPEPWRRYLAVALHGDLGTAWPDWSGWKLDAGALYSPDGWRFTRGELCALPFEYQRAAALAEELRAVGLARAGPAPAAAAAAGPAAACWLPGGGTSRERGCGAGTSVVLP